MEPKFHVIKWPETNCVAALCKQITLMKRSLREKAVKNSSLFVVNTEKNFLCNFQSPCVSLEVQICCWRYFTYSLARWERNGGKNEYLPELAPRHFSRSSFETNTNFRRFGMSSSSGLRLHTYGPFLPTIAYWKASKPLSAITPLSGLIQSEV